MEKVNYTVFFPLPDRAIYPEEVAAKVAASIAEQNRPVAGVLLFARPDEQEQAEKVCRYFEQRELTAHIIPMAEGLPAALNQALEKCETDYFILLDSRTQPVYLTQSATTLYHWAAVRNPDAGLFYSDYRLLSEEGSKEVHLLPYHSGRVRDNLDLGKVFLIHTHTARAVGGFSAAYPHGYLYDLRLKISEKTPIKLIASRFAGVPYAVEAPEKAHDVFDYLLSSKEIQLEMEAILTDHLRRIGAYLEPGAHYREVRYTRREEAGFADCLASVVIPVNHRPQFIGSAIESVLNQTVQQVEVIVVVNGGPNDPTIEAVKRYLPGGEKYQPQAPPVRLIVHDINNIGLCLNEGLRVARGKYYVQLDSDDRLKPDAVEKLLAVFSSDPKIGMVIGSYEVWQLEDDGRFFRREDIPVVTHDEWTEENGRNNLLRINGAGAPRSAHIKVLKEMGWFGVNDSPYSRNYGEDYEMVLKISERYRIGRVWEPIYQVVRHSGGTDHSIDRETIDRNDNAKDHMRLEAIRRRQQMNARKRA